MPVHWDRLTPFIEARREACTNEYTDSLFTYVVQTLFENISCSFLLSLKILVSHIIQNLLRESLEMSWKEILKFLPIQTRVDQDLLLLKIPTRLNPHPISILTLLLLNELSLRHLPSNFIPFASSTKANKMHRWKFLLQTYMSKKSR